MSVSQTAIDWFRDSFGSEIQAQAAGRPYTPRRIMSVALQETYYVWAPHYKVRPVERVLELCVGDTIDHPKRSAWPHDRKALLASENGAALFTVARAALKDVAQYNSAYRRMYKRPHKFCRGFGIFQYDLQFAKRSPDFFLNREWLSFSRCLEEFLRELDEAQERQYGQVRGDLTDFEFAMVAIAYNRGKANLSRGLRQGHRDAQGRYYGEKLWDFLQSLPDF